MKRLYYVGGAPGGIPNGDVSTDINPQFSRDLGLVGAAVDLNELALRKAGISAEEQDAISHIMGNTLMALLHELGIELPENATENLLRAKDVIGARIGNQAVAATANSTSLASNLVVYPQSA